MLRTVDASNDSGELSMYFSVFSNRACGGHKHLCVPYILNASGVLTKGGVHF
jgi:hypothetical protein